MLNSMITSIFPQKELLQRFSGSGAACFGIREGLETITYEKDWLPTVRISIRGTKEVVMVRVCPMAEAAATGNIVDLEGAAQIAEALIECAKNIPAEVIGKLIGAGHVFKTTVHAGEMVYCPPGFIIAERLTGTEDNTGWRLSIMPQSDAVRSGMIALRDKLPRLLGEVFGKSLQELEDALKAHVQAPAQVIAAASSEQQVQEQEQLEQHLLQQQEQKQRTEADPEQLSQREPEGVDDDARSEKFDEAADGEKEETLRDETSQHPRGGIFSV